MKKSVKILCVILSVFFVLSLAGCKKESNGEDSISLVTEENGNITVRLVGDADKGYKWDMVSYPEFVELCRFMEYYDIETKEWCFEFSPKIQGEEEIKFELNGSDPDVEIGSFVTVNFVISENLELSGEIKDFNIVDTAEYDKLVSGTAEQ